MDQDDLTQEIGKHIKHYRNEQKISQHDLAERSCIAATTLSSYENNKRTPSLYTLAKIANALNVTIDELYYGRYDYTSTQRLTPGEEIANAVFVLWKNDSLNLERYNEPASRLSFNSYDHEIHHLIGALNEIRARKDTYNNPEMFLEEQLRSAATVMERLYEQRERILKSSYNLLK
ncbi:helix-turn-helix domain-containing protein [Dialister sp.]|uniref:helix-turn-helix domain-containing protein n=1 Tax=Dialister sp. TaxID=1955814 RepID=UPI002E806C63|nr:helix-turn-helix transcriptional regulator [Dialister sp.]MEE3452408.1 helix-turn-helix transcriptional regulator [Dialister sp.]